MCQTHMYFVLFTQFLFLLSSVGKVNLTKAMDLIHYLVNETDIAPIKQAAVQVSRIQDLLAKLGYKDMAYRLKVCHLFSSVLFCCIYKMYKIEGETGS